jgi:hypothetical protein
MQLKVIPQEPRKSDKDQQVFQQLMDQIEELNLEKEIEREKLEKMAEAFDSKIPKLRRKFAASQLEIARQLAVSAEKLDLNRKQMSQIEELIVYFCLSAFAIEPPDQEMIAFFDNWSDTSYAEMYDAREQDILESFSDKIREMYGVDIDVSDLDMSPESNAKLQERIKAKLEAKQEEKTATDAQRKKSEKRVQKEAGQRNAAALKLKNIRSIYIALAKMLHPDKAISEADKADKEEWMKKVTIAYTERDLSTLLKLELKWITDKKDSWKELPEDKLKTYIASLKEQVRDLKTEISSLYRDPRFSQVADVAHLRENYALQEINAQEKAFKTWIQDFRQVTTYLQNHKGKTHVMSCVQQIRNGINR